MNEEYKDGEKQTSDIQEVKSDENETGFVINDFQTGGNVVDREDREEKQVSDFQVEEEQTDYSEGRESDAYESNYSADCTQADEEQFKSGIEKFEREEGCTEPSSHTGDASNASGSDYVRFNTFNGARLDESSRGTGTEFLTTVLNEKAKKKKNLHPLIKRVASFVLAAVLFGTVAGSTMVGINYGAKKAGIVANTDETTSESNSSSASASVATATTISGNTSSMDVSGVVSNVMPAVVAITNTQIYQNYSNSPYSYFFGNGGNGSSNGNGTYEYEAGSGSGIIIDKNDTELLIVTNNHVIENANSLTITFADNSTAAAVTKGTDSDTDLAVVSVNLSDLSKDTLSAIKVASLGNSDNCKVGEGVVAIGNALGYGQSVTVGYISALNRTITTDENNTRTVLQTDAAINPGNSGGALINLSGEVIGINCAKYSSTDVEGVGYAIPVSLVSDVIDNLKKQTAKVEVAADKQAYLGITGATIESSIASAYGMPTGVYVHSIIEGSAAAKSDLKEKDIITKFDGQSLSTYQDLQDILKYYSGGQKVDLTVETLTDGAYKEHTVTVTLGYVSEKPETSATK